jgi:hypothetical protein
MVISPNPASVRVEVALRGDSSYDAFLSLHNLGGSLISTHSLQIRAGVTRAYLDVRSLPAGTYFVRVQNKNNGRAEVARLLVHRN